MRRAPLALASLLLAACGPAEVVNPAGPTLGDPVVVVPFGAPPEGVTTQPANNNLDVALHAGRVFLAFRTAPSHFASDKTVLYVVSSEDQVHWRYETRVALGTDIREMRLLPRGDQLVMYFAVLGKDPLRFEPQGVQVTVRDAAGTWSEPAPIYEPGFILWRAKVIDDQAYAIGYVGGDNLYNMSGDPIDIHWLKTSDGRSFEPVVPGEPVVQEGGGSETDFVFLDDGDMIAVQRDEAGDALGWGSKICRAPAGDLGSWQCKIDKRKYDSPLLFRHGDGIWLIGRRNLTETGNYNLDRDNLSPEDQTETYEVEYSFQPKRCSLWRVDPASLTVSFVFDLPSKGDTCFASIVPMSDTTYMVYNYTSPLGDPDDEPKWIEAQGRPTVIYRALLSFPE